MKSGKARRLLYGQASTQPEKDVKLVVDGTPLIEQQKKNAAPDRIRWHRAGCKERLSLLPRAHWSYPLPDQNQLPHRRKAWETRPGIEGRKRRADAGA